MLRAAGSGMVHEQRHVAGRLRPNRGAASARCLLCLCRMVVAVVSTIYVQRLSTYGDAAAGAVLVSTVAFFVFCPLFIWLAQTSRF